MKVLFLTVGSRYGARCTIQMHKEGFGLNILLANDDGIHAPGLLAMKSQLDNLGNVTVVAPAVEQSGAGHAITFLRPLVPKKIFHGDEFFGWAVDGTPADCVKLGVTELCEQRPDLIVSGINGGLNAGINVLYSGTVAAAFEGAFFGVTSFAVSLESNEKARFDVAAEIASNVIRQVLDNNTDEKSQMYNLNIPTAATEEAANPELRIVPMGVGRYGEDYIKRTDPKGRTYYWTSSDPPPAETEHETDLNALLAGNVTVTPLHFNMTLQSRMDEMQGWGLKV